MRRPHHFSSPRAFAGALRFEGVLRARRARMTHGMERAGVRGSPVLAGPWLSEIGFELLYWIPLLRHELKRHGVAPAQVTALSRGGVHDWYAGVADGYVDAFDLLSPERYRVAQHERATGLDGQKQLTVTALDRELLGRAAPRRALRLHPLLMYSRLRYFWAGGESTEWLERRCRWVRFPVPPAPGVPLPERFVAVKPYFSSCFPRTDANRALVADAVLRLAEATDVVLLTTGMQLDDHLEPAVAAHPRVHRLEQAMRPADNLALQTRVAARAQALVTTYGGLAYLGLFLGVPAVSMASEDNHNPAHLAAARHAAAQLGTPEPVLVDARRAGAARAVAELALGGHDGRDSSPVTPNSASIGSGSSSA